MDTLGIWCGVLTTAILSVIPHWGWIGLLKKRGIYMYLSEKMNPGFWDVHNNSGDREWRWGVKGTVVNLKSLHQ